MPGATLRAMPQKRIRIRRVLILAGAIFCILVVGAILSVPLLVPDFRETVVRLVSERFKRDVELESLSARLFPSISATGTKLVIGQKDSTGGPPLISIDKISIHASLFGLLRRPRHVRLVTVEGFYIHVPPRRKEAGEKKEPGKPQHLPYVIDEIVADGTVLRILPEKAGKAPMEFDLKHLNLHSVGTESPMQFDALLTNPKPPGVIDTSGAFGPWVAEDPGQSFVEGEYTFKKANLGVFKGISGILASKGKYTGVLERIEVDGVTDTPDFEVRLAGNPVDLKTTFHAIVDGTDGDTYLQPVRASFGRTVIVARGAVEGREGVKGKTVALDVTADEARLEDIMKLAVKKDPPMVGAVRFKTKFLLPPGDEEVPKRLQLDGSFTIERAHFTHLNVQEKVESLSRRGKGRPEDVELPPENVASNMSGKFKLRNGKIEFTDLKFEVPGAKVDLTGTFHLDSETLDFRGHLRLDVPVSKTTKGIKSVLLKLVDPFFKKGEGSEIPIKITGDRSNPSFGLNIGGGN
ncbi:MAG TPA: AsmA-like C-terminal region-containing protein [Terriglobia bacterium]|nr:AsmA-like C-terminal region-containing protein [Terriglobia bacterium]